MQETTHPSIAPLDEQDFDQFLIYLNDHLSDNGGDDDTYFQPQPKGADFPPERAAAFRAGLLVPVGQPGWRRLWVARGARDQIIGHIDLRSHAERFTEHRCLLGMGIDRDHRRMGLGGKLIEHAEAWVRASEGLEWIDLQVLSCNEKAVRLYERSGFRKIGEIPEMFRIDARSFSYTSMTKHCDANGI